MYVRTLTQSGVPYEVMQMYVGANYGGNLVTRSQSRLKFSIYINDPVGGVLPSMEISSGPTRDVQINSPLLVKSSLSTFENSLFIGSGQLSTTNCLTLVGGETIGGKK